MSPSAVIEDSEKRIVDSPEPGGKSLPDTSTPDEKEPPARPTGRSAPPVTSKNTPKDTPPPVNKDNASSPNQPYSSGLQHMVGTGWSAMARIVREVDEQKIQGYKEDIDSILVFAGLFSAVMTAFLVESYHNLSQDPTQVMIFLMQQVASQTHSYTFNGVFLNSTAPPFVPNLPDFQPTVNAIRVNVLWFASLTLSLVSASFSILVKQWLREYLAGEYTSPQARLRIRHFRNPGLEHWKVFEIAAVIPLLLQLSLALFLIGLCFFTLDVHNSVGYTTLPLVAGWAFLFIAASFSPALSPRCPYKLTLLKAVMRTVRKYIFRAVLWAKDVSHRAAEPLTQIPDKWSYKNLAYDEEVAVLTDSNDIDILVSVDSIQSDEQLLSVMWGAVQQTQLGPAESFTFVMQIIAHRMQRDITSLLSSPTYLDLRRLPKQTITAVMLMISDLLRAEINHQSPTNTQSLIEWSPWMKDCIFILLSETGGPLPPAADDTLSLLLVFQNRYRPLFNIIRTRIPDTDTLPHVLDRLRGAFMQQNSSMLYGLYSIFEHYFCTNHAPDVSMHRRLSDLVKDHPEITHIHIRPLVEITVSSLLGQMRVEMYWHPWLVERIMHVLEMPSHPSYRSTVVKLMQSMLLLYGAVPLCCRFPMGLNWRKEYRGYAQELFIEAVVDVSVSECYSIIYNVTRSLSWQWKQQLDANDNGWARVTRMDPLETSYMVIRALKQATEAKKTTLEKHWIIVRDTLEGLEGGLKRVADMHIPDHPDIARRCLQLIDTLDRTRQPLKEGSDENAFRAWARRFRLDRTWFPDVFVKSLALFLPAGEEPTSYRLRRLRFLDLQRTNDVNVERIDRSVVDSPGSVAISRSASPASSDLSQLSLPADSNGTRDDSSEILSPAARDSTEQLTPRGNRFAMSRTSADPDEIAQHPDNDSFVIGRPYYTLIGD